MISYLTGKVIVKTDRSIIVDVQGVGYEIFTVPLLLEKTKQGQEISVYTHLYVREDIMELFGFSTLEELNFFKDMIGVSGIGPKSALAVLMLASVADLKKAIVDEDASLLTKVSGIGKKTAERLILELKNKITDLDVTGASSQATGSTDSQTIDALVNLGYSVREAREAIRRVDSSITNVNDKLKATLKLLGKK